MTETEHGRDSKTGKFLQGNKSAVKHGGHSFLITGQVPSVRGARKLKQELSRIRKELETSIPDLDVKKSLLIKQIVQAEGFASLFEMYCKKMGIIEPRSAKRGALNFQPGFKVYLSFLAAQKNALLALGLDEKRAEQILSPYELIQKEEKEKKEEKHGYQNSD